MPSAVSRWNFSTRGDVPPTTRVVTGPYGGGHHAANKSGKQGKTDAPRNRNEGEGSRSAAKAYNEATHRFVHSGKAPEAARDAERALSSSEHDEMVAAEAKGKARARH